MEGGAGERQAVAMGMLRRRAAVLAVGLTLFSAAATATAATTLTTRPALTPDDRQTRNAAPSAEGDATAAAAAAGSRTEGTVVAEEIGNARTVVSALRAAFFREPPSGEGGDFDGELIRDFFDHLEEGVSPQDPCFFCDSPPAKRPPTEKGGARSHARGWRAGPTAVARSSSSSESSGMHTRDAPEGLADRLIQGLYGSERGDLASKLILGGGLERAGALNLADKLLRRPSVVNGGAAGDREEFAAALMEAFETAGGDDGEQEFAEKFPGAAGEPERLGAKEEMAGKLLAGLDDSQQKQFAGALLSGMRHDATGGGDGGRSTEAAALRARGGLLDVLVAALMHTEPVVQELTRHGGEQQRLRPADDRSTGSSLVDGGHQARERLASNGKLLLLPSSRQGNGVESLAAAAAAAGHMNDDDDAPRGLVISASEEMDVRNVPFSARAGAEAGAVAGDAAAAASSSAEVGRGSDFVSWSGLDQPLPSPNTPPSPWFMVASSWQDDRFEWERRSEKKPEGINVSNVRHAEAEMYKPRAEAKAEAAWEKQLLERKRAAADSVASPSPDPSPWSFGPLQGMFRRTFERLLPTWPHSHSEEGLVGGPTDRLRGQNKENEEAEKSRRRLYTTSSQSDGSTSGTSEGSSQGASDGCGTGGNCQVEIVASVGNTSTNWNGAFFTVEVGTVVPGQTGDSGDIVARGTINEGESSPETQTLNMERGCYVLFTTAGTRPYDVIWEVQRSGELYQDAHGGGQDFHTFGVGGALCGMSDCYRQCYEEHDDDSPDECASFGDLLAPPEELAGASCNCTVEEELDLRLTCLGRDACDERSQCYFIGDNAAQITTAPTLTIEMYVTVTTAKIDTAGMEGAVAQWLDLDPSYVDLVLVNGQAVESSTLATRKLIEEGGITTGGNGREWGRGSQGGGLQGGVRDRRLQTATFKRLEFRIIGSSLDDLDPIEETINEGVRALNTVLAAQDEESGVQEVEAYTAEPTIAMTRVASDGIPESAIAGSGGGTGVDEEGEIIVAATEAPEEFGDFTRQTQFLIGAGLVVVVSFFLSIVACIVCHMKRKERKEFKRKNATVDGRPKAVAYVDPWGSVARTFQKEGNGNGGKGPGSTSSSRGGSRLGSAGSASMMRGNADGRNGSQTANSSASA